MNLIFLRPLQFSLFQTYAFRLHIFFSDVPRETFILEQPESSNPIANLPLANLMDESQKYLINKLFNVSCFLDPQHLILGSHLIIDGDDNNRFGSDRLSNKSKLYKDKINSRKVGRNGRFVLQPNFWCGRIYRIGASGIFYKGRHRI